MKLFLIWKGNLKFFIIYLQFKIRFPCSGNKDLWFYCLIKPIIDEYPILAMFTQIFLVVQFCSLKFLKMHSIDPALHLSKIYPSFLLFTF